MKAVSAKERDAALAKFGTLTPRQRKIVVDELVNEAFTKGWYGQAAKLTTYLPGTELHYLIGYKGTDLVANLAASKAHEASKRHNFKTNEEHTEYATYMRDAGERGVKRIMGTTV